ncbi:MAG: glycosyltransferase family 8 protein [Bacteroidota bacterium]
MSLSKTLSIVSVCDNHYVSLLAALMKSIEVNHTTGELIDYYIVEDNIRKENKKKLEESIQSDKISIIWKKIDEIIPTQVKLPLDNSSFPLNIYARLFIPYFIPENVEKVLYLDVDMIVLTDISKLFAVELGDKTLAAVIDRPQTISNWGGIANYHDLGLSGDLKYFNSGLLLMDPIKWKIEEIADKTINCINNNIEFANYPDQYGLNIIFAGNWLELDPLWNCHSTSQEDSPYIIHFSGRKPMYRTYSNNPRYQQIFDQYLSQTHWSGSKRVGEMHRITKKLYNKLERYVSLNF